MKKTNRKGFTLVEIMIVVAIIGLLAAIGIPSFQKARANSIDKSKANNVRIVNAAVEQYAMENAITNGASVGTALWLDYVKGGTLDSLDVGTTAAKDPSAVVGTDVKVSDLY